MQNQIRRRETPQNAASDQVFHCLLTEVPFKIGIKTKKTTKRTDRKIRFIRCSSGDERRLGGDEGLPGTYKERIKRMSDAYVTGK